MENDNTSIKDVIEVINSSKTAIINEMMLINMEISFLLNPNLNEDLEKILENNDLLKILVNLLVKSFWLYVNLDSNIVEIAISDSFYLHVYLTRLNEDVKDITNLIYSLTNFKDISLKTDVDLEAMVDKIILCTEMLKEGAVTNG